MDSSSDPGPTDYATLPRPQRGSQSQISLLTLLANYWLHAPAPIPSAALIDLLVEFDVSIASGRTTLSRLGRRGVFRSTKRGRQTFYQLSPAANALLARRTREVLQFGSDAEEWDGLWTCVAFSVPNERRHLRPRLRSDLRELGFAGLYDGLWVSPRPPGESLDRALAELAAVGSATVLRASTADKDGGLRPIDAFELDSVRESYVAFIDRFTTTTTAMRRGEVSLRFALVERTLVTNAWRQLNRLDPELPAELLPADWPRRTARRLFVDLYDGLATLAAARFDQIVANHDPNLTGLTRHFTTTDLPDPFA